jgi:hypothetical protein
MICFHAPGPHSGCIHADHAAILPHRCNIHSAYHVKTLCDAVVHENAIAIMRVGLGILFVP